MHCAGIVKAACHTAQACAVLSMRVVQADRMCVSGNQEPLVLAHITIYELMRCRSTSAISARGLAWVRSLY